MEEIAAYFWRRSGISSICFRMGARMVLNPHPVELEVRQAVLDLLAMPGDKGQRQIQTWVEAVSTYRQTHPTENQMQTNPRNPFGTKGLTGLSDIDGQIFIQVAHFWTSMDIRDRAQAFEKALTATFEGNHVLFINDDHNCVNIPSQALAELCYPEVTFIRKLIGTESLISLDKARTLIGFEPEYSVSRYF
jgi:hypothetical protein